jgi:hypothetical protein
MPPRRYPRAVGARIAARGRSHTLLERNVFGETVAIERRAYAGVADGLRADSPAMARSLLLLALAQHGRVGHIPWMVVCRDGDGEAVAPARHEAHDKAVRVHAAQPSLAGRIIVAASAAPFGPAAVRWRAPDPAARIAAIIPTRDNGQDLGYAVASLRARATAPAVCGS